MSTTINRLARWACELQLDTVPPTVVDRARLQHVGIAAAVRAGSQALPALSAPVGRGRGAARLVGDRSAPRRSAVGVHVALASALELDDYLLHAHVGGVAVPVAWAMARGHSIDELLRATIAANEVAGRVGASLLLAPCSARGQLVVGRVAASVTAGVLMKLAPVALAHSIALACSSPSMPTLHERLSGDVALARSTAAAAQAGMHAAEQARSGITGPLGLMDVHGGLLQSLSPAPLRAAFTGLGQSWLSQTLSFPRHPVDLALQVPIQGVAEILARHVKAADKRLRPDQIERIEIDVGQVGWTLVQLARSHPDPSPLGLRQRLASAVGMLVAEHELGPVQLSDQLLDRRRDIVADVAARVEVRHSWRRTAEFRNHLVDVAGPLLTGLTVAELTSAAQAWSRRTGAPPPPGPSVHEAGAWLSCRPAAIVDRLRYQTGDLAQARLDELQLRLGADVKVFTTRGGSWPERRDLPVGSPGWPWQETVDGVLSAWCAQAGPSAELESARAMLGAGGDAEGWVDALLTD